MDIIDIMLARALTPQGKTDAYVAKANRAAEKAAKAEEDAATAIATVESAADEIATAREEAAALLEEAQDALETAQSAVINMPEVYTTTGQNTDGYMTQKAVTDALNTKITTIELSSSLNNYATKTYVENAIANIPTGSGTINNGDINISFNVDDAGHILIIDNNGNLAASNITEESLINLLLSSDSYMAKNAVGLDIDYANKSFTRIQQAKNLSMGNDFNQFTMYGGRTKCNVADDGTINAFYGDPTYTEDGSNGQVMIYQPKFYYRRTPLALDSASYGKIIRHETLMLSATNQAGFKLAPIFKDNLEYVLLPAYDGSLINNKLSSIAGAEPAYNFNITEAESYATVRGTGWHIMNMAAEATNQMLEIVEFGIMNGQTALGQGITYNPNHGNQCSFITGSTASLGNGSGSAESTNALINGNIVTQASDGYKAITYRGMENPWGNLCQLIGGINVYGDGSKNGGTVYICKDFNYTPGSIGNNYEDVGFNLPSSYKWINAMGYGNQEYDWVFLPIECSSTATSLLPVGDSIWTTNNLNNTTILASGGSYGFQEECGPFYYAADRTVNETARTNYGAKLMYIPQKNNIYTANIAKWNTYMGG